MKVRLYSRYIGIDPGTSTGVAEWNRAERKLELVSSMEVHRAMELVKEKHAAHGNNLVVILEDARKWKNFGKDADKKAQGAGSVKRDSAMWEAFLKDNKINYQLVKPNNKLTKWGAESFKLYTKWQGTTNSHGRDAALLVYML